MFSLFRGLLLSAVLAIGVLAVGGATTTETAQARWGYGVGVRPYYGGYGGYYGGYRPYRGYYNYGYRPYGGYGGYGYGYPYYGYGGGVRVGRVGVNWW